MNKQCFIQLLFFLFIHSFVFSQGSVLSLGSDAYRILDRVEIKYGIKPDYSSSLKAINRRDAMKLVVAADSIIKLDSNSLDNRNLYYMYCENNEWLYPNSALQRVGGKKEGTYELVDGDTLYRFIPNSLLKQSIHSPNYFKTKKSIWKYFYSTPANWFQLDKNKFHLRLNPIINFQVNKSNFGKPSLFRNMRGVEVRGGIDDRIYFYSNITDTQVRYPEYVNEYIEKNKAVPGNGLYKTYKSSIIDGLDGYDLLNGQAFVGMNVTNSIGLQFGHGKNFIGNGYRSMFLSDFSQNYLYLKINWKVWKLHYQNLFTEINATSAQANTSNSSLPKKYMAAHYLSFNFTDNFSIGFFETVVFNRKNGFELQYLNPVILYRSVEHLLDSEDNILAGLDLKWNILKKGRIYSQLILDEYKLSELTGGDGWWGNKFGVQIGGQLIDAFGIDQLDLRAEYNLARPYTYSHSDSLGASYSHYNQSLAHPLGANFKEYLGIVQYQASNRIFIEGRLIYSEYGEDPAGENWGGNILLKNSSRVQEFGNEIGQGIETNTTLIGLDLSYEMWHNIYLDLHYFYRKKSSPEPNNSGKDSYFGGGFRMNIGKARNDF